MTSSESVFVALRIRHEIRMRRIVNCSLPGSAVQSSLGSRTTRIMNNSVYEQIFRTQSVSDDYCVSSYEHASRQHRGAINWEYQRRQYS